ncbi:DUF1853 family protein [uncultured Psychroserpens sp.]|uniref:DUF1853 family protein n=1 Tax=uncultured Psychroserpens sp. TaxID=255436 RepID=UPI00262E3AEA|nr:DUF1853 family protein [uncultured Psychroserpens sp.]
MNFNIEHQEHLYRGYLNTRLLWTTNSIFGLEQFPYPMDDKALLKKRIHKKFRLGQLAEQFTFNILNQLKDCDILSKNLQVQGRENKTIGELDALLEYSAQQIHLEIVYKFYLHDETNDSSEIEQWIGPNRNDSLIEKLSKLKEKQLPLLYSKACISLLDQLKIDVSNVKQYVLFKAQLFVPYQQQVNFKLLNSNCVCGFYINTSQLNEFKECQFYIPPKIDWLLDVNQSVNWIDITTFKIDTAFLLKNKKSPLFWLKYSDQSIQKCFLVWW